MTLKLPELFKTISVEAKFKEYCFGGYPRNTDLVKDWVKARTGHDDEKTEAQTDEAKEALRRQQSEEMTDACWTTFPRDEHGIYLRDGQIKACWKECMSVLRINVTKLGSKQICQHATTIEGVWPPHTQRIYFERDGKILEKEDGFLERAIHVNTAKGERSALKRCDYVLRPTIRFRVKILDIPASDKRYLSKDDILKILTLMQTDGLGADRSQEYGHFELISVE